MFYQITIEYDAEFFEYVVYGHRLHGVREKQEEFLGIYDTLAEALLDHPTADFISSD